MIPPITPIIVLFLEKENKYVRYHAVQSLLFGLMSLVLIFGLEMFAQAAGQIARPIEILFNALILFAGGGVFVAWLALLFSAFQGRSLKLPIIGDEAARRALN
jgi:uncharacterized membrane protein